MRTMIVACALLLSTLIAGGCASGPPTPTFVLRGGLQESRAISGVVFDATGVKPAVHAECQRVDTEFYCSPPAKRCASKRKVVLRCGSSALFVLAPWGKTYAGTAGSVPIPWMDAGIDPLSAEAPAVLKVSWRIRSADGKLNHSFVPSDAMIATMLEAIGSALDAQHGVESPIRSTELAMRFVETGVPRRLAIEVTNMGNASAYQVSARLRTGFTPLHGQEIVFGRIGPKQSKTWTRSVSVPAGEEGASPMIVAEVNASNAKPVNASSRFWLDGRRPKGRGEADLTRVDALKMDCQALDPRVAPGSRARVQCRLKNHGKAALQGLTYEIGPRSGKTIAATGPAEIPGGGEAQTELALSVSADAKLGGKLALIAVVRHKTGVLVSSPIEILLAQDVCTTKLTQADYATKRNKLESMLAKGMLTQADFDKYDADLVGCLQ